jgi:hypothetical protein
MVSNEKIPADDLSRYVEYVYQLREAETENAYHSLVDAGKSIVPFLIHMFHATPEPTIRSELVRIINQHRLPETIDFLAEALNDYSKVWKNALDGLVTLGGQKAIMVLETAKQQSKSANKADDEKTEWIDEAIQQIKDEQLRS